MRMLVVPAVLVLLAVFLMNGRPAQGMEIEEFTADKEVYYSGEKIKLNCVITSEDSARANLSFAGIAGRISWADSIELKKGANWLNETFTLPRCNVCGGIRPGNYSITAFLSSERMEDNRTIEVSILQ